MKPNPNPQIAQLCREPRIDDGLTPDELKRQRRAERNQNKPNHRQQQYAKAAGRTIDVALATECAHPPLDCLTLHQVAMDPGGSILHVTLLAQSCTQAETDALNPIAQPMIGRLRSILAASIRRRRTPHVRLHLLPGAWPQVHEPA
jgi:ribosome-binding factor A